MTNGVWRSEDAEQLAQYLVRSVTDRASGRRDDECLGNFPRDVYFIGNLRPAPPDADQILPAQPPRFGGELLRKLAPVAFGVDFLLATGTDGFDVVVTVKWASYYRVFPTYEQQVSYQRQQQAAPVVLQDSGAPTSPANAEDPEVDERQDPDTQDEDIDTDSRDGPEIGRSGTSDQRPPPPPPPRRRRSSQRDNLFLLFRKVSCRAHGSIVLRQQPSGEWLIDTSELEANVSRETLRAQEVARQDNRALRAAQGSDDKIRVPAAVLDSPEAYSAFCVSCRTEIIPTWTWGIRADFGPGVAPSENRIFSLVLTNLSPMREQAPNTEAFLFDVEATLRFVGTQVVPFELELAPRGFRYDRWLWGRGFNCGVEAVDGSNELFRTTPSPLYRQRRYSTRTQPRARFADLATNPIPVLANILDAMTAYQRTWIDQLNTYRLNDPTWDARYGREYERDMTSFEQEIQRFELGLRLIRSNPDTRLAFQLTNETFRRGQKEAWRLFQIVFLVSQIAGIVALRDRSDEGTREREAVDIIYFPTGGGKTEAYLGVIVFHLFCDRLRGKTSGVTAWTRFPLRLLTLQQTQRVADAVATAELVRREQSDPRLSGSSVDPFAVGYFVGEEATPNKLAPPRPGQPPEANWSIATDARARQRWKKIFRCPSCRSFSVVVDFDPARVKLFHRCAEPNCRFPGGILPIYVIDNEIYRYLPSVVVGTIDKLAALGNQRKLSLVLGSVQGRCAVHGYYSGRCSQDGCDNSQLRPGVPPGLSGPTLFVQDELHLLREGLGTFDSHYETFTQCLLAEFGQTQRLKIIASSATIEAFERQVEHLYGRRPDAARRFPGPGPTLDQSFYAETLSHAQRIFVGLIPHNKTLFNAVLEIIQYYHEALQDLQRLPPNSANPYGGSLVPGSQQWSELIDYYATSVTYFSNSRLLNSTRTDLESDTNSLLDSGGYRRLVLGELTGETPSEEVTRTLGRLENPGSGADASPDAVLATSMISHGVDVDRLNTMIVNSMPRQNAEYIQASSRVGRVLVGIVLVCFHPARERDQSHYAYFGKFHQFLGQLIEPVAINRWSSRLRKNPTFDAGADEEFDYDARNTP